jgi:hypothetical protein
MTPDQQRKTNAARVVAMFRPSQIEMDNAGHLQRELAFSGWFIRHEALTREVAAWIEMIGMRKEWRA